MPYIKQERRDALENGDDLHSVGELNYSLTQLLLEYANIFGHNYSTYNAIIGALECAKMEFYRRVINDYENDKMLENGDVFYEDGTD